MTRAAEMSIATIRADGWGERSVRPQSIPSAQRSPEKANSPRTFGPPSGREALSPIRPLVPVVPVSRTWLTSRSPVSALAAAAPVAAAARMRP